MSASDSIAETPEFAMAAETNQSSENTINSGSRFLTDRPSQSRRSGTSQSLSWSLIQQSAVTPANTESRDMDHRSRPAKRAERTKSPHKSKSPRRNSTARGSDQPLTADQRLDQLIAEDIRSRVPRGGGPLVGMNLLGSPAESPMSPTMVIPRGSPQRE